MKTCVPPAITFVGRGSHESLGRQGPLIGSLRGLEEGLFSVCASPERGSGRTQLGQVQGIHIVSVLCLPAEVRHEENPHVRNLSKSSNNLHWANVEYEFFNSFVLSCTPVGGY